MVMFLIFFSFLFHFQRNNPSDWVCNACNAENASDSQHQLAQLSIQLNHNLCPPKNAWILRAFDPDGRKVALARALTPTKKIIKPIFDVSDLFSVWVPPSSLF